jgi:hypothetical protein
VFSGRRQLSVTKKPGILRQCYRERRSGGMNGQNDHGLPILLSLPEERWKNRTGTRTNASRFASTKKGKSIGSLVAFRVSETSR